MPDDPAAHHFHCTDRERAAFEAGIKLGAVFHQFVGLPVSRGNAVAVERAITECVRIQPFVTGAEVRIERAGLPDKAHEYDYRSLTGDMLRVGLTVTYGAAKAEAGILYDEDLAYPLMFLRVND